MSGARAELELVIATLDTKRASQEQAIIRPLEGGKRWTDEYVKTLVDSLGRTLRELAIARQLLRALDEIDRLAGGSR